MTEQKEGKIIELIKKESHSGYWMYGTYRSSALCS